MSSQYWNDDAYPGRATVYIEARWGEAVASGSGAIIGRNDVLTASHVIYDPIRGYPDSIHVYPSYNPQERYWIGAKYYSPSLTSYFTDFDPDGDGYLWYGDNRANSQGHSEKDIALLSFSEPLGDTYGWFGWLPDFSKGTISKLGYPGAYDRNLVYDSGIASYDSVDNTIAYGNNIEVNPGDSGGPLYGYFFGEDFPRVLGVVSTGSWGAGIKGHNEFLTRMTSRNDDIIGSPSTSLQRASTGTDALTGVSNAYDMFIFDAGTASTWNLAISSQGADSIYGYESKDHLRFNNAYYLKDIAGVDATVDSLTSDLLPSILGSYSIGSTYGLAPSKWSFAKKRKGNSRRKVSQQYKNWQQNGSQVFSPFAVKTVYSESDQGTWLLANDAINGFDLNSDSLIFLAGYRPTPDAPLVIL